MKFLPVVLLAAGVALGLRLRLNHFNVAGFNRLHRNGRSWGRLLFGDNGLNQAACLDAAPVGRPDQRSPAKRSFSGTAAPVASLTRTKVSMPINSPNFSLPILRKKMFSP